MATFKEIFAKKRAELGAGKTFVWPKSEGGDGKSYSTDYATEKKSSGTGTKPKAKPAGLNPQSGAAQSGVAGKVKPKESVSGASRSVAGKVKPKESVSGASRSTAGKVVSMMDQAKADAKARREASQSAGRGNNQTTNTAIIPTAAVKPLTKLMQILSQGGFSNYMKKK